MNIKTKEIYSEVYQILNLLGMEYIDKLPTSLFNMLKEKRDVNYNPEYTYDIPLAKQNIRKETLSIITLLNLNYWCESEEQKLELMQILKSNEEKYQKELREKYNPADMFKKNIEEKNVERNESLMVEYKESIFRKIINKIKNVFYNERL